MKFEFTTEQWKFLEEHFYVAVHAGINRMDDRDTAEDLANFLLGWFQCENDQAAPYDAAKNFFGETEAEYQVRKQDDLDQLTGYGKYADVE